MAVPVLLITRPEPAASETAAQLRAAGYRVLISPALVATAIKPQNTMLLKSTVLIVTSPQAARFLKAWKALHLYKVIAVGTKTAVLLKAAGFTRITEAGGDAAAILALTAKQKSQNYCLLGAPTTGRTLLVALKAQGHKAHRLSIYRIAPATKLVSDAKAAFEKGLITHLLFYSARTVESFLALASNINFYSVTALCFSTAVAKAARKGTFCRVLTAARPTAEALQALLPALDSRA